MPGVGAGSTTIFGRPGATPGMAQAILDKASSLSSSPSPAHPASLTGDEIEKAYYLADYAVMQLQKIERDPAALAEIASFGGFVAQRIRFMEQQTEAGPPAPPPGVNAPMQPQVGGAAPNPMGGVPQGLGSTLPPGAPAAPPAA